MRTINEIAVEIKKNGYANLTDEEIEAWVESRKEEAATEALTTAKLSAIQDAIKETTANQKRIADAALEAFNAAVSGGSDPVTLEF